MTFTGKMDKKKLDIKIHIWEDDKSIFHFDFDSNDLNNGKVLHKCKDCGNCWKQNHNDYLIEEYENKLKKLKKYNIELTSQLKFLMFSLGVDEKEVNRAMKVMDSKFKKKLEIK